MNWLISADSKVYDHASSFEHHGHIDWKQNRTKYAVGDIVYIYCTSPAKRIRYKGRIDTIDLDFSEIRDDKEYWIDQKKYEEAKGGFYFRLNLIEQIDTETLSLENLLEHELKAAPQGPKKLHGELLSYIEREFTSPSDDFFPDESIPETEATEGIRKRVYVNKYERSSIARAMCIEHHRCHCGVCGFDFEKEYGKLGRGFIHVHHITPIHKIGKEYKIDYKNDLIPVCPNCHAMLHRKVDGKELTVEELRNVIRSNQSE